MTPHSNGAQAAIDRFVGPYAFLSNFHPSPVWLGLDEYPTVEHAFQAAKTNDPPARDRIRQAATPGLAKRYGRRLTLADGWDSRRETVMRDLVQQKFLTHHGLANGLLATGHRELIEGNTWGDHYWGVCNGRGENRLGHILVETRALLVAIRIARRRGVPSRARR